MSIKLDEAADPQQVIADLRRELAQCKAELAERAAERDEALASEAAAATENARLSSDLQERTRDLQETLEYQTAATDVLKVIGRSGGELDAVLQTLTETAARICDADTAAIIRLRDGQYWVAAACGFAAEWWDFFAQQPVEPNRSTVTGRAALEQRIVHVEDVTSDPEYRWLEAQRLGKYRTALGVPLLRDEVPIGVLTLSRSRVERFTGQQVALVATFADQAVIAIENARLINETREALEQQIATAEVLGVINASMNEPARAGGRCARSGYAARTVPTN